MSTKVSILLVVALILSACGDSSKGPDQTEGSGAVEANSAAELTATAEFHRAVENMLTASASSTTATTQPTGTPTPTETPVPTPLPPEGVLSFSSDREGNWDIFVIQGDGSNTYNITNNQANDNEPAWSPSGTEVLFTTDRDGDLNIYRMMIDGSGLVNLTPHEPDEDPCDEKSPEWSIDGLYVRLDSTCNEVQTDQVFKYDLSNLGAVQIDSDVFPQDSDRGLSPDGSMRLQEIELEDNLEIMIGPSDGSDWVNLTNSPGNDSTPVWSPDGRYIAYVSDRIQPHWNPNLNLDAHPPAPTPTPTLTATPTPTSSPTAAPTLGITPDAIVRRPYEKSPGNYAAKVHNDTGAEITIYFYGNENYIFYIPPGRHKIYMTFDSKYSYTIFACGGTTYGSGLDVNHVLEVWCED
jgi:TolB protein